MIRHEAATAIPTNTVNQVRTYYGDSPGYLDGPLKGTCHFGYTPQGQEFELRSALSAMETRLGQALALPHGSTVIDAGCGFGRVATTLSGQFGLNVIGADLMSERLHEAYRYAKAHGVLEKVNLLNVNYCAIPVQESSIDGIFTMETLVHADPLEAALSEFWRVLKPGGRLTLFEYSVPDRKTLDPLRKRITDIFVQHTGMASIERFTHGAFPDLLQNAGFENVQVEEVSRNVWPTWRWMFWRAIHDLPKLLDRQTKDSTNLIASLLIYPYRRFLGYNIVTANKPQNTRIN
jgi:ubiquinone/menaquinone biosynthesis C-methylase UbiE